MRFVILFLIAVSTGFAALSERDILLLKQRIKILESRGSGDLYAENSLGYLGRYQFGAAALTAVGLIRRKRYISATYFDRKSGTRQWRKGLNNKSFLADPGNWKLSKGKNSFLGNEILQENAMSELIRLNYAYLKKTDLKLSKNEEIGFLMAAHLGGIHNALKYLKRKIDFKDAHGTAISKYYRIGSAGTSRKEQMQIERLTKKYLGGRYVWGGTTPHGFDCSGYTRYIYRKIGIDLPRTALEQSKIGKSVSINDLEKGDLLFFLTDKKRGIPVTHVGVYLEDGKFIHAAGEKIGIIISRLADYKSRFVSAKRILGSKKRKEYPGTGIGIFDENFFKPMAERAILSPTKAVLKRGFKYKIINGKYVSIN